MSSTIRGRLTRSVNEFSAYCKTIDAQDVNIKKLLKSDKREEISKAVMLLEFYVQKIRQYLEDFDKSERLWMTFMAGLVDDALTKEEELMKTYMEDEVAGPDVARKHAQELLDTFNLLILDGKRDSPNDRANSTQHNNPLTIARDLNIMEQDAAADREWTRMEEALNARRLVNLTTFNNEFFEFDKHVPDRSFYEITQPNEHGLNAAETIGAAQYVVDQFEKAFKNKGNTTSIANNILFTLIKYTPLAGNTGQPLFTNNHEHWKPKFHTPTSGLFHDVNAAVTSEVLTRSTAAAQVAEEGRQPRADREDPTEGDEDHVNGDEYINNAGSILRGALFNLRFLFKGEPEGALVFTRIEQVAGLIGLAEETLRYVFCPASALVIKSSLPALKSWVAAYTLAASKDDFAMEVLNLTHLIRLQGTGLILLNLLREIADARLPPVAVGLGLSSSRNREEMARSLIAFNLYYTDTPLEEIDLLGKFFKITFPADEKSRLYGKYARCLSSCMQWCTGRSNTVSLQQLQGALTALDPSRKFGTANFLQEKSREKKFARSVMEAIINDLEINAGRDQGHRQGRAN